MVPGTAAKGLIVAVVAALLLSACMSLPTVSAPAAPAATISEPTPDVLIGVPVGYVYIRAGNGVVTDFLKPGEAVMVYGTQDGWCWLDRLHLHKAWCSCLGIGSGTCREARNEPQRNDH